MQFVFDFEGTQFPPVETDAQKRVRHARESLSHAHFQVRMRPTNGDSLVRYWEAELARRLAILNPPKPLPQAPAPAPVAPVAPVIPAKSPLPRFAVCGLALGVLAAIVISGANRAAQDKTERLAAAASLYDANGRLHLPGPRATGTAAYGSLASLGATSYAGKATRR